MESTMMSLPIYVFGLVLTVLVTNWITRKRNERRVMRMLRRLNEAEAISRRVQGHTEMDRVLQRIEEIS